MRSAPLIRVLARLGLTLATRGPWARLRGLALAAGAMLLVAGLAGVVLAGSYAHLRQERADAIRPTPAAAAGSASLLTSFDGFGQVDDRPVTVMSIWPLRADAPLPPGVSAWPAPGQAVLSPTLLAALGPARADLYGTVAGTIGPTGLEVPTERRVYLRPTTAAFDATTMQPAQGFGHAPGDGGYGVGVLYANSDWMVTALVLAALLAPALVALGLATSLDGETRDHRTRLLTALGASRRHRALVDTAEALPAVLIGAVAAAVGLVALCLIDVRLPYLDAILAADAARRVAPELFGAVPVGVLLAILTVTAIRERPRWRRTRTALRTNQSPPWVRTAIFVAALAATIGYTANSRTAELRTLAYIAGAVVVAVTLPAVVAVLLVLTGRLAGAWGLRRGSAGALAGGRRLHRYPHRTARLALGLSFGILAIGQVQLWSTALGTQYYQALQTRAQLGETVATADHTTYGPAMTRYVAALPDAAQPGWTSIQEPPDNHPVRPPLTNLTAPCATLSTLGLRCVDGPVHVTAANPQLAQILLTGISRTDLTIHVAARPDQKALATQGATFLIVSPTINGLPLEQLQRTAYATVPGGLQLETIGQGWVTQGQKLILAARWTVLLGSIGLAIIALAGTLALAGDVIASGASLTRLAQLSARTRWIYVLTLWRTAVPLTLVGALGAAVYLILPSGISHGTTLNGATMFTPSPALAIDTVVAAATLAVVVSTWAARRLTKE